jgi:hypothetical protein
MAVTLVDSVDALAAAVRELFLHVTSSDAPTVVLDLEGMNARVTPPTPCAIVSLCTRGGRVLLFDMHVLGRSAWDTPVDVSALLDAASPSERARMRGVLDSFGLAASFQLRCVLESRLVAKLMWDCRYDAHTLNALDAVQLSNVVDLQVAVASTMRQSFLPGLNAKSLTCHWRETEGKRTSAAVTARLLDVEAVSAAGKAVWCPVVAAASVRDVLWPCGT